MTGSDVLTCGITLDFLFSAEFFLRSTIYCAQATRNLSKKNIHQLGEKSFVEATIKTLHATRQSETHGVAETQ